MVTGGIFNGDDGGNYEPDPDPDAAEQGHSPSPNTVVDGKEQVAWLLTALERLANNTTGRKWPVTSEAKLWDPNQFKGSDPTKLQGFLLQCKLNFWAKLEFLLDAKVSYVLSPWEEWLLITSSLSWPIIWKMSRGWLTGFDYFTNELYIYFSPYDQQAKAKVVELEQLRMKDNYEATKFFCWFLQALPFAES
jgi:hypothetical protein